MNDFSLPNHQFSADHNKSSGPNVKCISTTALRRGAICIVINNADEDGHLTIANDMTLNSDTEHCDIDIDNGDDDEDTDSDEYANDSAKDNNNIQSSSKMLRTKTKRKMLDKTNNITTTATVNPSRDAQVHPKKSNFWHNLLVTPKNGKNVRFIDYFRYGSRDIHRKTREG